MEEFLARENIRRFEAQLKAGCEPEQRAILEKLLGEERQKLRHAQELHSTQK